MTLTITIDGKRTSIPRVIEAAGGEAIEFYLVNPDDALAKYAAAGDPVQWERVDFTDSAGEERKNHPHLTPDDFPEGKGSGKDGRYTVADVKQIADETKEEE